MPNSWEPASIIFKVGDFDSVKSFYKAVLSLRIVEEEQDRSVTFQLGSLTLRLEKYDLRDLPSDFGRVESITFNVRSVGDLLEVLDKLNVDYSLSEFNGRKHLDIADPEGRVMTFISKF